MTLQPPTWAVGVNMPTKPLERPVDSPKRKSGDKASAVEKPAEEDENLDYAEVLDGTKSVEVPDEIRAYSDDAYLGDRDFILLTSSAILAQLPKEERILRTTFVREYLYDFDPLLAAIRVGFLNVRQPSQRFSPAMNAARSLMAEPVVQRLIKECMLEAVKQDDSENIVYTMLLREATNHGVSGNAAARNGAYKMLLDTIEKVKAGRQGGEVVKGNVMLMPVMSDDNESWEKKAMVSQKLLKDSVSA